MAPTAPPPLPGTGERPKALVLDVNGTLFPATAAAGAFTALGLDPLLLDGWFSATLRDAIAAQLAGGGAAGAFVTFAEVGAAHLGDLLRAAGSKNVDAAAALQSVVAAWRDADMHPEIAPALKRIKAAGIQARGGMPFPRVCVLTNGAVDAISRGLVARAGLEGVVAPLLDVNMAQAFKPDPRVYRFAASQLGLSPGQCMMVASHPWDINGALSAGLRGAYVERGEAYPSFLRRPEAVVGGFDELADLLLGKPE